MDRQAEELYAMLYHENVIPLPRNKGKGKVHPRTGHEGPEGV
jgi:hypothetical protein